MVTGGVHPYSGVEVPALDADFDASLSAAVKIFYQANTDCLTEGSDFASARDCTLQFATQDQAESVVKAWDAVGVVVESDGGDDGGSGNDTTPTLSPTNDGSSYTDPTPEPTTDDSSPTPSPSSGNDGDDWFEPTPSPSSSPDSTGDDSCWWCFWN